MLTDLWYFSTLGAEVPQFRAGAAFATNVGGAVVRSVYPVIVLIVTAGASARAYYAYRNERTGVVSPDFRRRLPCVVRSSRDLLRAGAARPRPPACRGRTPEMPEHLAGELRPIDRKVA